ncbi:hypothetical protein KIW84_070323 [Lathyrus oleraceus]|uniref:PB1-like domain-containing protein n=1 Tax=Pisum sativum TaxID=3888 RepID=A0A9D4VHP9_PEA|nr:hypothetical protein KIW84_070323 [Pisum sativum]
MFFTLNFHYGGTFVRDNVICYIGEHEHIVDIDPDKWVFFKANGIVKDLCHLEYLENWLWWYNNESDRHNRMVSDSDANEVYKFVVEMKSVVDIYIEHKVVDDGSVNVQEEGHVNNDGVNVNGVINAKEDEHEDSDFNDDNDDQELKTFKLSI